MGFDPVRPRWQLRICEMELLCKNSSQQRIYICVPISVVATTGIAMYNMRSVRGYETECDETPVVRDVNSVCIVLGTYLAGCYSLPDKAIF